MRILFLTQWFQPEPFFKGMPFVKALRAKGHDVEVLTGFPNYPGGILYPGYRVRLFRRQIMDGIKINRVALYPSHDKSALRRILNYVSFSLSALFIGPWLIKAPDVVYVYNLVSLGPPAFLLRYLFGAKVLIDVQDLWPASVTNSKMIRSPLVLRVLDRICNYVYSNADQLVVLSPGFKSELTGRGINPGRIEVIYNWCDEAGLKAEEVSDPHSAASEKKFNVLFAGSIGLAQGLDTLLDCAQICQGDLPQAVFTFVGGGVERERLMQEADGRKLDNVFFLPPRPMERMGELYAAADALLVHLKDDPLFRITIPSKIQAYLAVGRPILVGVRGDAADLVRAAGAGIDCQPEKPESISEAVEKLYRMPRTLLDEMGDRGRRYYREKLSLSVGVSRFEEVFQSTVAN